MSFNLPERMKRARVYLHRNTPSGVEVEVTRDILSRSSHGVTGMTIINPDVHLCLRFEGADGKPQARNTRVDLSFLKEESEDLLVGFLDEFINKSLPPDVKSRPSKTREEKLKKF